MAVRAIRTKVSSALSGSPSPSPVDGCWRWIAAFSSNSKFKERTSSLKRKTGPTKRVASVAYLRVAVQFVCGNYDPRVPAAVPDHRIGSRPGHDAVSWDGRNCGF